MPFQRWIKDGHTIHPPIEGLLPPICIEPTLFQNSAFKVAGLQAHVTTLGTKSRNNVFRTLPTTSEK